MIRFDYYMPSNKLPRWVVASFAVGGTTIALCLMALMVHLGRTQLVGAASAVVAAGPSPVPATSPVPAVHAPVADAAPAVSAPVAAPAADAAPVAKTVAKVGKAHHGHAKHGRLLNGQKTGALLAKHDSAKKRRSRDDLDRMLGM